MYGVCSNYFLSPLGMDLPKALFSRTKCSNSEEPGNRNDGRPRPNGLPPKPQWCSIETSKSKKSRKRRKVSVTVVDSKPEPQSQASNTTVCLEVNPPEPTYVSFIRVIPMFIVLIPEPHPRPFQERENESELVNEPEEILKREREEMKNASRLDYSKGWPK